MKKLLLVIGLLLLAGLSNDLHYPSVCTTSIIAAVITAWTALFDIL